MVSPYPPLRDGIAAYAVQAVAALRAEGHDVEVLSPGPSAAHHHLDLAGPRGALALARRVRNYDRVIVQFHPDIFYRLHGSARDRLKTSLALTAAFRRARHVEVRLHEIDYRTGRLSGPGGLASRLLWRSVDRVTVHTDGERDEFIKAFGVRPDRVVLAPHGEHFARRTRHDRASARRSLGLPEHGHVFLAIGFIQPHKGFDRAVRAFAGLGAEGAQLHVVGSVRVEEPAYVAHLDELRNLVEATAGAHLHTGFVSDELFDRWVVASDTVVLPYRHIWSSGVMERAALYGVPVLATAVGGLAEQAGQHEDVTLVSDDAELRTAMWTLVRGEAESPAAVRESWPVAEGESLQAAVQADVRRRAARRRGSVLAPGRAAAVAGGDAGTQRFASASSASAPLRRVHPLQLPSAQAPRPGAALVKRVVRRVTAWQMDPVVHQVNALREATVEALERAAAASSTPVAAQPGADTPAPHTTER
ncbi:MAG: glycosyltransferase [Frankiales bacterium]|nr:glycosyltransferase [Frankiales bacterium]